MYLNTSTNRVWQRLKNDHTNKNVFCDNCGGHNTSPALEEVMLRSKITLNWLVANATDLYQPADSFVISKIKDAWKRRWEAFKLEMMDSGAWCNDSGNGKKWSGKLKNPGKSFFLKLAADAVREVNSERDADGLTYARKAMIKCGLSKNVNGVWDESQLFKHLQEIIKAYRVNFDGEDPSLLEE